MAEHRREFDPVDWMSGALYFTYAKRGEYKPRTKWVRDAELVLEFLGRHGIVLARIGGPEGRTLRAWRLSDLICRIVGHRPPQRWYANAAGDAGGWLCTRCLTELPGPPDG